MKIWTLWKHSRINNEYYVDKDLNQWFPHMQDQKARKKHMAWFCMLKTYKWTFQTCQYCFFGKMDKAIVLPHPTYASLHKQRKKFNINTNLAHFPRPHSHGHLDSILTSGKTCTMVSKKGLPFCIGTKFHTIK